MGKQIALLEYTFMFKPDSETWTRGSDFEKDLSKFFDAHGLEAEPLETVGGASRRVIFIRSSRKLDNQVKPLKKTKKGDSKPSKFTDPAKKLASMVKGGK